MIPGRFGCRQRPGRYFVHVLKLVNTKILPAIANALGLMAALSAFAQDSPVQRHEMATNHLKHIAAEMSARGLSDIRTLDDFARLPILTKDIIRDRWRDLIRDDVPLERLHRHHSGGSTGVVRGSSLCVSTRALLVDTRPRTTRLPLGRNRSGSKPPARAVSYSRK